jgi:hypothetical protein
MNKNLKLDNLDIEKNDVTSTFTSPILFNKKKNKAVYKSLDYVLNDTGMTRHYPPAAQE